MSGHSKWSTIKHKKAAKDAKRGKMFTKLIREITVAARLSGGDPAGNPRLRTAILAARAESMPGENIERAIKKGAGGLEGVSYEDITYEGYGPGGVAILVSALTDNRNRTVADIRGIFTRHGGSMGETGCVGWMFHRRGIVVVDRSAAPSEDRLIEVALEAGADDVAGSDEVFEVATSPEAFEAVRTALEAAGLTIARAELGMIPQNTVQVTGAEAGRLFKLLEALEDHDDVQSVAANADLDEDEIASLSA